jgi:predicted RNA-binding Zn-ribbon protein involved in translation (DUF1610 family)
MDSKLLRIVKYKCPHCGMHDIFTNKFPKYTGGLTSMYKTCPSCNTNFEPEVGFYWGAMYISYALTSGAFLIWALICLKIFDLSINATFLSMFILGVMFFPIFARLSRSIWLGIFYDKE